MGYYKIYAGLGGGFGGAEYLWTDQYTSEDEAVECAYNQACELYYNYQGFVLPFFAFQECLCLVYMW